MQFQPNLSWAAMPHKIIYHNDPAAMTLMKNREVITRAKRDWNLFTFNLVQPGKAMTVVNKRRKAIAIIGRGRPTHLVSQNKYIRLWHRQLGYISNVHIVRVSKLVDGIDLDMKNKEYDPAEVLLDSDDLDDFNEFNPNNNKAPPLTNTSVPSPKTAVIQQTTSDLNIFDKLCMPYVGSKLSQIVQRDKSMTAITSKLEKMHADLWGLYRSASQSGNSYAGIFMCKQIQKTWTLYLQEKDNFVNAFQAWLPRIKTESGCSIKVFQADGGGEFISIKLRTFYKKQGIIIKYAAPYMHKENGLAKRG